MKNSTFSAQVANNLLTLLQGYSKTIRLLLVMFLTLTVTTNAWGADYELVSFSDIKTNDVIIIVGTKSGTAYAMKNTGTPPTPIGVTISNSKITSTATDITFTATNNGDNTITFVSTTSGTLYCTNANNGVKIGSQTGDNTKFSFDSSVNRLKNIGQTRWLGIYNTQDWRCYTTASAANISGTTTTFYRKVTAAPSHTITATSNNNSYGTVSVSGTTITATPNDGYRVKSGDAGYTVTSGTAVVTNNGNNTFSVTPSSNCAITINFEAIPKYAVTWNVNGEVYETTQVTEGSKPTFPATPSSCDATSNTFYGWATATWDGKINDVSAKTIYISANDMPAVNGAVTYYAVFATKGAGGGTAFDGTSGGDFKIYALVEGVKKYLSGTGSKISPVDEAQATEYTFTKDGSVFYIQTGTTYLTYASSTNLGTSTDPYGWNISEGTKGSWRIASAANSSRGIVYRASTYNQFGGYSTSNITADGTEYYDVEIGGGASVSYSGYITTCAAGDPCASLQAPNVTATATANSITLSWDAVGGATSYNIYNFTTYTEDETTELTYTFTGLAPETEYEWEVESAKGVCFKGTTGTTTTLAEAPTNYTITLNPNYPAGKTGTFKDKEENTVNGNLEISLPANTESQKITNLYSSISLEGYIFEGWYEAADGNANRTNTGTITQDITFYAHWKVPYTVTFNAGTGNCATESITETTANGIQLPTATLTDCGDWTFLGWAEAAIASETTTPPASILAGGSTYKPTGNITLYAIYKRVEGGGGGEGTEATLTFDDTSKRTTLTTEQQVWTENNITLTNDKASSTSDIIDSSNPTRFYKNSQITVSAPETITKIVATTSGGEYTTALVNSVGVGATTDGNTVTITPSASSNTYTIQLTGGQTRLYSITVTYGGGLSTSYYHSNPVCQTCENILTISKGTETNGTFTLDFSGDIETCETEVSVVVEPTPANHYHIGSVTATTPTTGGAPTVTDNDNGTYTITYAANSTGTSIINVTFAENAKATITLYELGVPTTITTEYVGDKYTLPSTSSQSCGTKTLVGWSAIAFAETDTRPTENYYGISTQITLAETQTFYAVFAQSNGGGGGNGDYVRVTAALDDWSGDYLIAYNNETFANGSTGGTSGMGAEGNKQDLSLHINNNTIPANIGDLYNVTLVTVDGGYVLQTKDNKYNYQSSNANGLAVTDNIETAKQYPLTVTFNNENDIAIAHSHGAIFHYNKNSLGYFRFYRDGGQQPVYLYKKSGTAATYTGYTTSCAVITGIEVDNPKTDFKQYDEFVFGGTVYAVDENDNQIDVTTSATFSGYDMKKAGTDTVTVTYLTHSTTYEITIEKVNAYALTWNVSGATNTGLSPAYVIPGNAIGKLPTPKEIPAGCEGKTFVGWTESNTVNSDGTEITFITSSTVPTQATTYYAVFATPSGNAGDGDYVKVTEDANDLSGKYLIVYEDSEGSPAAPKAFNGGLTTLDAANNTIDVTIDGDTIESTSATDAAKFTIAKDGEGDYTIKSASGKYIGRTADANDLDENESTPYKNTITFTDSNTDIIASGGAYLRYNKNSGAERFRYYKSDTYTNQQPIALYKKSGSSASYTDYTTGCQDVTITYYGFTGGYTTNCGGSDLNRITQRVNSEHTIPNCGNITDPTTLGRTFLNLWKDQNGKEHKPGDSFIVTQDITLYAQWKLETTGDIELPADKEDLATTDIVVTGGKTLTIPEDETITINSLTLKGGLLGEDSESGYAMPSVVIPEGATLVRKNTTINLDLVVNSDSWYPFAVPFAVANNGNIDYLDPVLKAASTYNTHFAIKTYDGANRAIVGTNQKENWDKVPQAAGLQPGKGYIISALTYPDIDTATIRIPMTVDNEWLANGEQTTVNEVTRNQVAVTAHTGPATDINNGGHQRHAGWNFVANPYLSMFAGTNASNEGGSFINGEIIINKGDYSYSTDEVPYVTIPTYNFEHYYQVELSEATLSPAYSFFVQVGKSGTMTFDVAGRQAAPASIAARNAEERPVKMDVDITLSDNHSSDQTGIIISDRYSDAYEIGRDLEKLFGSAYNLSVYTLMADNTPLAFQALAIRSNMQVIPVGYRAPEQGEYTFRLNEATSSIDLLNEQYEQLVLVDYQTGELTNLLIADYTFYSERTQADNRFAIYTVPRQNAPTDLPNAIGQDKQAQKIIHNGHLYILRDGNVYNGNGQIVK